MKENNDRKNPTDRQTGNKSLTESHYLGPIIDARGRDSAPFHLAIQKDPAGGRARESEKEKLLLIGKANNSMSIDGRWVEIRSTGMMMTSQADSRIKGGKKDPSSFSRSCFSLFIHCNSIVVDRWLIVSRCRPSRTQHGPSQPDNQIISRIKNGDRS